LWVDSFTVDSYDESGEKVVYSQISSFVRGAGNFGGKRASDKAIQPQNPPSRAPDASIKQKTNENQVRGYAL
jgi:3-hydroxyacyl-CoA dehydrogenase/3a,7a,12a-trihydroxy-5b-cholest-24-enoyl-CoA hydratase